MYVIFAFIENKQTKKNSTFLCTPHIGQSPLSTGRDRNPFFVVFEFD